MSRIAPWSLCAALVLGVAAPTPVHADPSGGRGAVQPLPKPGARVELGSGHYFTYGFASAPKLGTAIMRVEIFTSGGARDTSFVVRGDADMPSMRGAHATGDKDFALSAKGVYLLPIQLVMPGDWEVKLTFVRGGAVVFSGTYRFDL